MRQITAGDVMFSVQETFQLLGGEAVFRRRIKTAIDAHELIQAGFPAVSAQRFMEAFNLQNRVMSRLMGIQPRTLQRKRRSGRWNPVQSDRLFRAATVYSEAERVLGSREKAKGWLNRPNRALGGCVPQELVDTEAGANQILALLGRIQHGVFS
jgi:putative toxin-antitoxin system antitoxin component (TIGR02293 family)